MTTERHDAQKHLSSTNAQPVAFPQQKRQCDRPAIPAAYARRKTNGYLSLNAAMSFSATDSVFVPGEPPIWQMTIRFRLPSLGTLATLGIMDVDAWTGEVLPLSQEQIKWMQDRANAIAKSLFNNSFPRSLW